SPPSARAYQACANFAPAKKKHRRQPGDAGHGPDPGKPQVRGRERCSRCIRSETVRRPDPVGYGPGNCRRNAVAAFVKLKIKSWAKTISGFLIASEIRHPAPVCEIQPLNLLSFHRERPFERTSQPISPHK